MVSEIERVNEAFDHRVPRLLVESHLTDRRLIDTDICQKIEQHFPCNVEGPMEKVYKFHATSSKHQAPLTSHFLQHLQLHAIYVLYREY